MLAVSNKGRRGVERDPISIVPNQKDGRIVQKAFFGQDIQGPGRPLHDTEGRGRKPRMVSPMTCSSECLLRRKSSRKDSRVMLNNAPMVPSVTRHFVPRRVDISDQARIFGRDVVRLQKRSRGFCIAPADPATNAS